MDFGSNSVIAKNPNFMYLGLLPANTTDKIKSVIGPTTRVERLKNGSDWLASSNSIEKVTAEIVSEAKASSDYILKNKFETMKVFERENISVTRPTLENISVTRPTFPISPSKNEFTI